MLWQAIIDLFSSELWLLCVVIPLIIGFVFCIVESIIPGFGIFGILGMICEVGGVVAHAIISSSILTTEMAILSVFLLIVVLVLLFAVIFMFFVKSAKSGFISKTPFVENKTALPKDFGEELKDNITLIGKTGVLITDCRPVGKVEIDNQIIEVLAIDDYIEKNEKVKIIKVDGSKIYVELLKRSENV